jgi:hypothetical protein
MTDKTISNGTVVWFTDQGLEVRGICNGDPYQITVNDGTVRRLVPVHQPQTTQNLIVSAENIYRVGEHD